MTPMSNTINLISNKGVTFQNAFVNAPICCPSRSTLLTGLYSHNTGVRNNSVSGGCASLKWRTEFEPNSIAPLLKQSGYQTFYAGKYLNQYGTKSGGGASHVPVGWDSWYGLIGNSCYYNYTLSENGRAVRYTDTYLTDLIKDKATEFLDNINDEPYFMMLATPAPHAPFTPAPRHRDRFPNVQALRTPAFNYTPTNKHWLLQMPPNNLPGDVSHLDQIQEHRFESLLAVDEMVQRIVSKVERTGQLNNTFVIYTSDNGFHIGQFVQPWDKRQPYDTDIRVPLLIRGPGLRPKTISQIPVQSVDLAPTILQMAEHPVPSNMDGRPLLNEIINEQNDARVQWHSYILIEYHGEGDGKTNDELCPWKFDSTLSECSTESWCKCQDAKNNTYNCVRQLSLTKDFLFCRFIDSENFVEAYDIKSDKYQLQNIFNEMTKNDIATYDIILQKLINCSGVHCRNLQL
ncbi:uncharacterized protein CBL_02416 [Carabus blaptoides fortunei]